MTPSLFLFQQALADRSSVAIVSRDSQHCWRGVGRGGRRTRVVKEGNKTKVEGTVQLH